MTGIPKMGEILLGAEDLHRAYRRRGRSQSSNMVAAVAGVSFRLEPSTALGIVGQSGSGKSTLVRLLLAIERPDLGTVWFNGAPISDLPESSVRPLRRRFQAVFQDPGLSLDPCLKVGTIVAEPLVAHGLGSSTDRRRRVAELLAQVGLAPDAATRLPKAFSGGERQRIAIARALATGPELLILDEPVSSLDATVQAQILDLICELRERRDLALVFVSHDLEVVRDICDRVAVMKEGRFVEEGRTDQVLEAPKHPYTRALLEARPQRS
jgi:peptide/nickel transport system ATP-binding protein